MNTYTRLLAIAFLLFSGIQISSAQSNFEVELAAFNRPVSLNYFAGIEGIVYYKDANDIHRYRIQNLSSEKEAKEVVAMAKSKGVNARLIDVEVEMAALAACQDKIDHLFFDFDQSKLTRQAKKELDDLAKVLRQNPDYVAVLAGHTDSKGGSIYNESLARARVESAKTYLLSRNVAARQINGQAFGEEWPIAKNASANNEDLPVGRKFNRRVEIQLINTSGRKTKLKDLVNQISVPSELKY